MIKLLDEDMPSRRQVQSYQAALEDYQQELMDILEKMLDKCEEDNNAEQFKKLNDEVDKLVEEYGEVQQRAQEYLDYRKEDASSTVSSKIMDWQRKNQSSLQEEIEENERKLLQLTQDIQKSLMESGMHHLVESIGDNNQVDEIKVHDGMKHSGEPEFDCVGPARRLNGAYDEVLMV